jgi:hypothetical protein
MRTVVALYDTREIARKVIEDLVNAGFDRDEISIATRGEKGEDINVEKARDRDDMRVEKTRDRELGNEAGEGAAVGGGVGAVLGGIGGLLVGLGTIVIPGAGVIVAAGPLVGLLGGAVAGGIAGGLLGGLIGLGIPEEDARVYAEGVRRGGTLVIVRTADEAAENARSIMERHNPVNIERSERRWREMGWEGYHEEAAPMTESELERERQAFAKERYEPEGMRREHHGGAEGMRMQQQMGTEERSYQPGRIETDADKAWDAYQQDFMNHYQHTYADTGHDFGYYQPAYKYGCQLAQHEQYGSRDWEEIEAEARRRWRDVNGDESWMIVRDAVRESFDRCESGRV